MGTLEVYLTGFGRFHGQEINPTSQLISVFSKIYDSKIRYSITEPALHNVLLSEIDFQKVQDGQHAHKQNYTKQAVTFGNARTTQLTPSTEEGCANISYLKSELEINFSGINLCRTEVLEVSIPAVSKAIPHIHDFMTNYISCNTVSCKDSIANADCVEPKLGCATSLEGKSSLSSNLSQQATEIMKGYDDLNESLEDSAIITTVSNFSDFTSRSPLSVEGTNESDLVTPSSINEGKLRLAIEVEKNNVLSDHPISSTGIIDNTPSTESSLTLEKYNAFYGQQLFQNKTEKGKVILHMGVDAGCSCVKLEKVAFNEASFVIPDERNLQPIAEAINSEGCAELHTILPLEAIVEKLNDKGIECEVSFNPGRFLCNYAYYLSLHRAAQTKIPVLFVHVPPFHRYPIEKQLIFVSELLQCLREFLL